MQKCSVGLMPPVACEMIKKLHSKESALPWPMKFAEICLTRKRSPSLITLSLRVAPRGRVSLLTIFTFFGMNRIAPADPLSTPAPQPGSGLQLGKQGGNCPSPGTVQAQGGCWGPESCSPELVWRVTLSCCTPLSPGIPRRSAGSCAEPVGSDSIGPKAPEPECHLKLVKLCGCD